MIRICQDCGRDSDEDPEDPAPGLCPECYDERLARLFAEMTVKAILDPNPNPFDIARMLEEGLVKAGERPDFARKHAQDLLRQMLFGELSLN